MGLLTVEEREALRQKGLYVKEKCDGCGDPLLTPFKWVKGGKDFDEKCYKKMRESGEWRSGPKVSKVPKINQEEGSMAKEKSSNGAEKVAGMYRANSLRAIMYQALEDEKVHDMKEIAKIVGKDATNPKGLLLAVKRDGEGENLWGISINGDKVQMKLGKGAAAAVAKATAKTPPAKATSAKQAPAPAKVGKKAASNGVGTLTKAMSATVSLVRKVLKAGGPWTKNKVVEELKTKNGLDQKAILAAISREVSLGGVVEKKGQLSLA